MKHPDVNCIAQRSFFAHHFLRKRPEVAEDSADLTETR
jgi:hypothetical protein